jgi:membrane-bound transcription factor site-1 protease
VVVLYNIILHMMGIKTFVVVLLWTLVVVSPQLDGGVVGLTTYSNSTQEYIVMFNTYMEHETHQHLLQRALTGMENQWHIIKRNNPGSMFPSDFALISVTGDDVVGVLKHQSFVKHVIREKRIVNPLQAYEGEGLEEEEIVEEPLPQNATIHGRYHRWFPEVDAPDSIHLPGTRKLHSSVFQVTELFNAHDLWGKHTGTGVNVAIFDTGLRRGHPHFRNVIDITNWTDEDSTEDGLGHGTFVTGMRYLIFFIYIFFRPRRRPRLTSPS